MFLSLAEAETNDHLFLTGPMELCSLEFTEITVLRRLTLRMVSPQALDVFVGALSTITSPVFRELVHEVNGRSCRSSRTYPELWLCWKKIDKFLEGRFAEQGDFRVVIRTGELYNREPFRAHMKKAFPFLAKRGQVGFEASRALD